MEKYIIKILSLATMVVFLLQGIASAAGGFEIKYNVTQFKIEADGVCEEGFANISVIPGEYIDSAESLDSELSGTNIILKTVSAPAGVLDEEIILGDSFPVGCYLITVESGEQSYKRFFVKSVPATVTTVASEFPSSEDKKGLISSNITDLGFDTEIFSQYGDGIVSLLTAMYSTETVTEANFTDMYLLSEGIVLMKNDKISAEEMITLYGGILGADVATVYSSESEAIKENLADILPEQNFSGKAFGKVFNDCLIVAKINVEKTSAKDDLVDYLRAEGEDLTSYDSLTSYYQGLLFGSLTDNKTYTTREGLLSAFNTGVAYQLEQSQKNTSSSGGSSGSGGGGFSISDKPAKQETTDEKENEDKKASFTDINGHWAEAQILKMAESGILNGYDDGSFKPNGKITRAEFVKVISDVLSLPEKTGDSFFDVSADKWYAPFVYAASSYGIINGISDSEFGPEKLITRQDATVILHRVLSKENVEFTQRESFTDGESVSDYAKNAVEELSGKGIIKGFNGEFRPADTLTRAETVAMLGRILEYVK